MESGPDASICDLFGKGRHVGPTVGYARCRRAGYGDLRDVYGSEYRLDDTRDAAALDAMRARIFGVHRGVGDRLPGCVTISGRVAIRIAVTNRRDRPPEVVMVLGVQHGDDRVAEPNRHQRHEPRAVDDAHLLCGHELAYEGVIGHRWTDEPEPGRLGLLGGSLRAVLATVVFELVVIGCPFLALQRNRRAGPKLGSLGHHERPHVRPH